MQYISSLLNLIQNENKLLCREESLGAKSIYGAIAHCTKINPSLLSKHLMTETCLWFS